MDGAKYLQDKAQSSIPSPKEQPQQRFPTKHRKKKQEEPKKEIQLDGVDLDNILTMPGLKLSKKSMAKLQYLRSKKQE